MKCIGLWATYLVCSVITDKETEKCKYYALTWSVSILFMLKKLILLLVNYFVCILYLLQRKKNTISVNG